MENVSHNTSFDSADDNLSRDPNQQPFEDENENVDSSLTKKHTHQETELPAQFQVFDPSGFV